MPRPKKKTLASSTSEERNTRNRRAGGVSNEFVVDDIFPSAERVYRNDGLDGLRKIYKLGMAGFKPAKDHTTSHFTRPPQYYDKHLDRALRPVKVAYCPGLNQQIAEIADRHLEKYVKKFGPPPACSSTDPTHVQHVLHKSGPITVRFEEGILRHCAKIIPDIILPIVSALALETSSWETQYLTWTTELSKNKAVPDAALRIDLDYPPPGSTSHDCPFASLDQGERRHFSGEASVQKEEPILDCPICDHPSRNELKDVDRYFPCVTLYEFKNLLAGSYEHMIALLEMTCDDIVHWEECVRGTCEHDTIDFRMTGRKTGFDAANPFIHLKAGDWAKTEIGLSLCTSEPRVVLDDEHRLSAKHIFQQIWSEMVKHDATFLVLSCGNIDMIVARNRAEKILYLGDPIRTTGVPLDSPEPGYIQMLVGLSIASIRDAIDRAAQLKACEDEGNLPLSWTMYTDSYRVEEPEPDLGPVDVKQLLSECRELRIGPKKGSGSQYRLLNLYKRYPPEQSSYQLKIKIRPIVDDDNSIFIGTVKWKGKIFKDCVIVKTAGGKHATRRLSRESCIFRSLMGNPERCKIPFMYGFFVDSSNVDAPYAVMLQQYVGSQLSNKPSPSQKISLERTLKYAREKGYEYRKILMRSIVVGMSRDTDSGEAELYLVGLSKLKSSQSAPESEDDEDAGLLSTLYREFKRRKKDGPCIYLGPISSVASPKQEFERITGWVGQLGQVPTLPETARCVGWANSLPDWLEISVLPGDISKFEELWDRRPDHLKRIVYMRTGASW